MWSNRDRFGVEPICHVLEVSASAYWARRKGERCTRQIEDERLLAVIEDTHARNYFAYGYRRMWRAGGAGRTRPRQATDALWRDPGRQATRAALADDQG